MSRRTLPVLLCLLGLFALAPAARADTVDDHPSVAAQGTGDMRVFIRGGDGQLWTRSWNGTSWSDWSGLGGVLTSGPVAVARPGGVYSVFVRTTGNAFAHKSFTPATGWSAWEGLGGGLASAPGATYRQGSGEVDVFGTGTDGQLWHKSWSPSGGWSAWNPLGGAVRSAPSAISPAANTLDVYVRGADDKLYQKYWTPESGWVAYIAHGGELTSAPSATAWSSTRRDIFTRGAGGTVMLKSWNQGSGWGGFASLGATASSAPGATSQGDGRLSVFTRDPGGGIATNDYSSTGWTGWRDFGAAPPVPPGVPPPAPPAPAPLTPSELDLNSGLGCVPQGGRLPVHVNIRPRPGRPRPRVSRVLFYVDRAKKPRRLDRRRPFKTSMRVTFRPGSKHRVYARVYYKRSGNRRLSSKTVSRRFLMCRRG